MTHLRLKEGFELEEYQDLFKDDFTQKYQAIIDEYIHENLAQLCDGKFAFTDDGLMVMDRLLIRFF